jgi:hypothetical protein
MNRRDLFSSVAIVAGTMLWDPRSATSQSDGLSDEQLRSALRYLAGLDLEPGEAAKVLASLHLNRFDVKVEPTVQPQADFDPEVDT